MINLDKTKYQGATADKINDYNWVLKDKIVDILDSVTESTRIVNRNMFYIWDPLELTAYICDSLQ